MNGITPSHVQEDSTRDDEEAKNDFWTVTGEFIYRHHVEHRVNLYMPKEATFPIPTKYIDVTRNTHTSLDVMMEKILKITGTWMEKENYQMHGQASQDSFYQTKRHLMDIHDLGEIDEETNDFKTRQIVARYVEPNGGPGRERGFLGEYHSSSSSSSMR